jgi:hypothetical protein
LRLFFSSSFLFIAIFSHPLQISSHFQKLSILAEQLKSLIHYGYEGTLQFGTIYKHLNKHLALSCKQI